MHHTSFRNQHSEIRNSVLRWYRRNARAFPWRKTRHPYRILVSEIMLQQTQASRVVEKYPQFLKRFSSLNSLARARQASVIRAWRGMGYNNRAVRLRQLAQQVMREHKGKLPRTVDELDKLPGIGKYTAHAVACFAYGQQVPAVDTNIRRILTRLFPSAVKTRGAWEVAGAVLPRARAYDWNQSLFDLGASVCTVRNPKCSVCPVSRRCPSAFKVKQSQTVSPKREPGREGIPNRVYRGRVVEILRNLKGDNSITVPRLGMLIKKNYTHRDAIWLRRLLLGLERDSIITLQNGSSIVRVTLAR